MRQLRPYKALILALLLVVSTLAVYYQVRDHEFVVYDDYEYVIDNLHVRTGLRPGNIAWAFRTFYAGNWHPLTWLSHMLDCQLYGLNPKGHHLNNLILHLANVLLLFVILSKMTDSLWRSLFVAALFALHPLQVESVAWVAERKNLLSTLFWFIVIWRYRLYVRKPGTGNYLLCLIFYALGLMAKPMLVTIPLILLLLDYWPLGRFTLGRTQAPGRTWDRGAATPPDQGPHLLFLISEKVPFLCLAAASGVITFLASESSRSLASVASLSLETRLANTLVSYAAYIVKMVWPAHLAFFYPHPLDTLSPWLVAGACTLLLSISFMVVLAGRPRPYLVVGWLWYLITLIPVIGLLQVGAQAMADRYAYVPLIGLFIMIAWLVPDGTPLRPSRRIAPALCLAAVFLSLSVRTWSQAGTWRESARLFEHALRVTRNNYFAHYLLGYTLERKGDIPEAVSQYVRALAIKTDLAPAHNNLGRVLASTGELDKAVHHYSTALKIDPRDWRVYYNLGNAFAMKGDLGRAVLNYAMALRINPDDANTHNNLGSTLVREGRIEEALRSFAAALRLDPNHATAKGNLHHALEKLKEREPR
jgi:Flp pilus assembly protein TadD